MAVQVDRLGNSFTIEANRQGGLTSRAAMKGPCYVATTANITLSGEQTIDGVAVVAGKRVLVKSQTDQTQNGIYLCSTGDWTRAPDFYRSDEVYEGTQLRVTDGTAGPGLWVVTAADPITIGTTAITFSTDVALDAAPLASPAFTGTPTAPTAAAGTDTTQIATTGFVQAAITAIKDGVSSAFDTLAEIATALGRAAYLDTEDQVLTGGVRVTSKSLGTITTGTVTLDPGDRPLQHYTNNGAHTLAPGANAGSILLDITNGGTAGVITTSGWTFVVGAFTTASGDKFRCSCSVGNGGSLLSIQALQ